MGNPEITSPADLAEQAAEAIRALNHATIFDGYEGPGDVYGVISGLLTMAQRLPQALNQASSWLNQAEKAGRLRHDQDEDVAEVVDVVRCHLRNAGKYGGWLAEDLGHAHEEASHLGAPL